ncbi:MAG: hypothetical protein MMC23_002728 [Stictis urceolatum]|nr:hypothetical protein [Stictis urceolata]
MAEEQEVYDLLIILDGTYSMSNYIDSLQQSLPKIIAVSALTDAFSRVGLLTYRDYSDDDLLTWSGWMSESKSKETGPQVDLVKEAGKLYPNGGGDYPEATKTGLAKAFEVMRDDATTIVLLYTDAPPHTAANGTGHPNTNHGMELKALEDPKSYGGFGPEFRDWVSTCRCMAGANKKRRAQVFPILEPRMARTDGNYYTLLSAMTGGACLYLKKSTPEAISKVTVDLLLAWMGAEKTGAEIAEIDAALSRYQSLEGIQKIKKEAAKDKKGLANTEELALGRKVIQQYLPRRKAPVQDFAKRYQNDASYKHLVVKHLQRIIEEDVVAVSLNPIFGSLWRAVCNDRNNENREGLISSFGLQVDRIANADEKQRMKTWLAESYDYSAEVSETIETIPESQRYPCVFLDPTLAFTKPSASHGEEDDEEARAITDFRRDELLEIGRSCDYKILRRLGRVLTRLTFVNDPKDLPAHIANAEEGKVTRIPLALASREHGRKLWRILLHIVVPGTMLSARPAALLAALSIKLGIKPLYKAADTEMLMWKDKWNDIEVPETWNVSCLSLVLDADQAYYNRQQSKNTDAGKVITKRFLKKADRDLFSVLVSYKMLELNLQTTLTAKVGWTPSKTTLPIGPVVTCRSCKFPRSVTIMGVKQTCGICLATDYASPEARQEAMNVRVSADVTETSDAVWVECFTQTCRAQYIVYDPDKLNVRAKCHYCRQQPFLPVSKRSIDPAPRLECHKCLNRVICPIEYRPSSLVPSEYTCVSCSTGHQSITDAETTAQVLSKENGTGWLLENKADKLKDPLGGRTLYHQISSAGTADFTTLVTLFPPSSTSGPNLTLAGKQIHNTPSLLTHLQSYLHSRRTEAGTCSLCFTSSRKSLLRPSCGRRGCTQRICAPCLNSWYGLNASGRIINIAALHCPFCRRAPTAKTLNSYGMGIHAVGDLKDAVKEAGEWVYAWCAECVRAKRFVERVCARGAPPEVGGFRCEECRVRAEEEEKRREAELRAEVERIERAGREVDWERREGLRVELERRRKGREGKVRRRECPGCEVVTERTYGCGHMACPCGVHWCWFCGKRKSEEGIYGHMDREHGGLFEDGSEEEYGEEYEEEYAG